MKHLDPSTGKPFLYGIEDNTYVVRKTYSTPSGRYAECDYVPARGNIQCLIDNKGYQKGDKIRLVNGVRHPQNERVALEVWKNGELIFDAPSLAAEREKEQARIDKWVEERKQFLTGKIDTNPEPLYQ